MCRRLAEGAGRSDAETFRESSSLEEDLQDTSESALNKGHISSRFFFLPCLSTNGHNDTHRNFNPMFPVSAKVSAVLQCTD